MPFSTKRQDSGRESADALETLRGNIRNLTNIAQHLGDPAARFGISVRPPVDTEAPLEEQVDYTKRMLAELIQELELKEQIVLDEERKRLSAYLKEIRVFRGQYESLAEMLKKIGELHKRKREK